jgi:fatty-acyl-CoA synthase
LLRSWRSLTTYSMLYQTSKKYGDRDAVISSNDHCTYNKLVEASTKLANGLASLGIKQGGRVATLMYPSVEWILLKYAVSKLGAIIVPLNIRLESAELYWALKKAKANALVVETWRKGKNLPDQLLMACPSLKVTENGYVYSSALPELHWIIQQGENIQGSSFLNFEELFSLSSRDVEKLDLAYDRSKPSDLDAIIFTSGSTNTPKGAMLSHQNVIGHAYYLGRSLKIHPSDRYLNMLPFYHIAGYVQSVLMNHYFGCALYIVDDFLPKTIAETIEREHITASAGMPITINRLLDYASSHKTDLSSLKLMHGVSPEVYPRLKNELTMCLTTRMYGLTESAGLVSMAVMREGAGMVPADFIGHPLPGVSVRIEDEFSRKELPTGERGEIVFNGWNRFLGYFDDPEITMKSLTPDGFFKTGDCGYLDPSGELHFSGRYKDMIKTGGENVSAVEVEQFLKEKVPGIQTVVVVGLPNKSWGEAIAAVIEMSPGYTWEPLRILKSCTGQIATYKIPRYLLQKPAFVWPVLPSGKVDKQAIKEWATNQIKEESNAT